MRATVIFVHLIALGVIVGYAGCAAVKATSTIVTECALAVAPAELEKALPVAIAALDVARRPDGTYDEAQILDVVRSMSTAIGGCAFAEAFVRAMVARPPTFAPRTGQTPEDRAWAAVQARQFQGRRFKLASGAVL